MEFTFDLKRRDREAAGGAPRLLGFARLLVAATALFSFAHVGVNLAGLVALHREARGEASVELPDRAAVEAFNRDAAAAALWMRKLDFPLVGLLDDLEAALPPAITVRRVELSLARERGGAPAPSGALVAYAANLETASKAAADLTKRPGFRDVTLTSVDREGGKTVFRLEFHHAF